MVESVLGPVPVGELGVTLVHEHLFMGWPGWDMDPLAPDARSTLYLEVLARLREAAARGVRTIVDATPADLGRDVSLLQAFSRDSGLNVIAATGIYHEAWGFPIYLKMRSEDELAQIFVHELTTSIGGGDVRAGVVKVASAGSTVGKHEARALRAAALAGTHCGVPVITHSSNPTVALHQATALVEAGMEPWRVQIGHCDGYSVEELEPVLATGVMVAFDQFVYPQKISLDGRARTLAALIDRGYTSQLVLSHDQIGLLGGRQVPLASSTRSFSYLLDEAVPAFHGAAVTDATLRHMMVANPSRLFGGAAVTPPAKDEDIGNGSDRSPRNRRLPA